MPELLFMANPTSMPRLDGVPSATEANLVAISKMVIELPILRRTQLFSRNNDLLIKATDNSLWTKLGELHQADAVLAENSRTLIRRKQPQPASLTAKDKSDNSDPIPELINRFQKLIAIDSVRNEYLLHSQLHQWFMKSGRGFSFVSNNVESLKTRVYDELFLTPQTDRWLGLMPGDGYTGIDQDGIVK
jgi:hypothetical protein